MTTNTLSQLSDLELLDATQGAAAHARHSTVELVRLLTEVESRRLYLGEGFPSMFVYCTRALALSEHAAYVRIEAARASRRFPALLEDLAAGEITLTTIRLIGRHLTDENCAAVLAAARRKGKREIEELAAALAPRPDVQASVRKAPVGSAPALMELSALPDVQGPAMASPLVERVLAAPQEPRVPVTMARARARIESLAPSRYLLKATISAAGHAKLRRAQDLLRHVVPDGDPAVIVERALALLVEHLERTRLASLK